MTTDEIPLDAPLAARIAHAVDRYGEDRVIAMAVGLLSGRNEGDDILLYFGGRHARGVLDGAPPLYWPELWGARALTVVWPDAEPGAATSAVLAGLGNQAWRVREMCAKVCAAHGVGDTDSLSALLADEVPRVRSAAARALAEIGTTEQLDAIRALLKDADKDVRRAAQQSLDRLRDRTRPTRD
ncbi:HEAT repeat domain-containing protein [Parafrigoribacterium soli]|uniref:HEAT repeat domain-containing protein n=1 Tax=Parafrigoribacterium soli TaxID=3144663 RepID=UPI0032ED182C